MRLQRESRAVACVCFVSGSAGQVPDRRRPARGRRRGGGGGGPHGGRAQVHAKCPVLCTHGVLKGYSKAYSRGTHRRTHREGYSQVGERRDRARVHRGPHAHRTRHPPRRRRAARERPFIISVHCFFCFRASPRVFCFRAAQVRAIARKLSKLHSLPVMAPFLPDQPLIWTWLDRMTARITQCAPIPLREALRPIPLREALRPIPLREALRSDPT